MQKAITSKALSLLLATLLALSLVFTLTLPSAAMTLTDQWGEDYEVNFDPSISVATSGTTATVTENGVTVTATIEGMGWGVAIGAYEGIELSFSLSGTVIEDGELVLGWRINNSGSPFASIPVYAGDDASSYTVDNYVIGIYPYSGTIDILLRMDFNQGTMYSVSTPAEETLNGLSFYFYYSGSDLAFGKPYYYYAENSFVYGLNNCLPLGTATDTGTYTLTLSSAKANYSSSKTLSVVKDQYYGIYSGVQFDDLSMPAMDIDDFVFNVTFTPASTPNPSNSGSSSGGGSSNRTTPTAPANTPQTVTTTTATNAVNSAVAAAKAAGSANATANIKNPSDISLATLKAMAKQAANMPLKLQADSMSADNRTVDVRITLDPSLATSGLNLSASTTNPQAVNTTNRFAKFFSNDIMTVALGQQGSFGQPVTIAAKLDPKLDTDNLVFYSYDSAANSYKQIPAPNYRVDSNGYVHFTTELAGNIIISDGALIKK